MICSFLAEQAPPLQTNELKSILILKLGSLGDVVHTLPLVNVLRDSFPRVRIGWIVEKRFSDLIERHPSVDEVFVFDRVKSISRSFRAFIRIVRKIRSKKYDIIVDLQGNLKGSLFVLLSGCCRRMGFRRGSSRIENVSTFFTNWKVAEEGSHIIERNLSFAKVLGVEGRNISFRISVLESAKRDIDDFLKGKNIQDRQIVIMHPGVTWVTKRWALKNYSLLAEKITKRFSNSAIVVTAGPGESALADKIQKSCSAHTVVAKNMNLSGFTALLDRCDVFISSDTGPLHLAAALGKKVIGLYGPTDPVRNGPYGSANFVIRKEMSCSGCWQRKCSDVRCMDGITVSDVMGKVEACLKKTVSRE